MLMRLVISGVIVVGRSFLAVDGAWFDCACKFWSASSVVQVNQTKSCNACFVPYLVMEAVHRLPVVDLAIELRLLSVSDDK